MESYLANGAPSFRDCYFDSIHACIRTRIPFLEIGHRVNDQQIDMDTTLR